MAACPGNPTFDFPHSHTPPLPQRLIGRMKRVAMTTLSPLHGLVHPCRSGGLSHGGHWRLTKASGLLCSMSLPPVQNSAGVAGRLFGSVGL